MLLLGPSKLSSLASMWCNIFYCISSSFIDYKASWVEASIAQTNHRKTPLSLIHYAGQVFADYYLTRKRYSTRFAKQCAESHNLTVSHECLYSGKHEANTSCAGGYDLTCKAGDLLATLTLGWLHRLQSCKCEWQYDLLGIMMVDIHTAT